MIPELDRISALLAFVMIIAVGVIGLLILPIGMTMDIVLMMVLPSMLVFGAIMLAIGVGYGKHRAAH